VSGSVPGMTDSTDPRISELEQQLMNERRERETAQRRAAELFDRVSLWRARAEDRTDRIKRLEAERDRLKIERSNVTSGFLRRRRRATTKPQPGQPQPSTEAGRIAVVDDPESVGDIVFPGVKCATALEMPDLVTAMSVFDSSAIGATTALMDADVVVVDAAGLRSLDDATVDALTEWASVAGRPPLIVTSDVGEELSRHAQNVLEIDDVSGRFFAPSKWSPPTRRARAGALSDTMAVVDVEGFGLVVAERFNQSLTSHLELAATATPFMPTGASDASLETLERAGTRHRRFAYEHRTIEMERLMSQLELDVSPFRPSVAGVIVSNRPDDLRGALLRLANQRVHRFEVVVGCHGFSSSVVRAEIDQLAETLPLSVLEFDTSVSLGACLNHAVASTGADIIAKLDDDDHYGPSYLIDAVHALEYGGTPVIGKGTTFTYMESLGRTVLRRPGNEERVSRGSPTGATLVWKRWLWERDPFAHRSLGEDVGFLRGARRLGFDIYINSRFEFVYHRRRAGNTWQAADELFLEGAADAWDGEHPERADVPDLEFDDR
jgi:hypothetical protein